MMNREQIAAELVMVAKDLIARPFHKRSLVMISDLTDWTAYFADNPNETKDSTDKSAMKSALANNEVITMGKTVVTPYPKLSDSDRRNLQKYGLGVDFDI